MHLLILLFLNFGTIGINGDSAAAQHAATTSGHAQSARSVKGPFTVDPMKLQNKTGIPANHRHNEQDNFKRPDTAPYRPGPLGADSTGQTEIKSNQVTPSTLRSDSAPTVAFQFDAESCTNLDPPDNSLAVSNAGFIISGVNCGLYIYNQSGTLIKTLSYPTFFNTPGDQFSDPRIIYDFYNDRFIFFIQFGDSASTSTLYVAFSSSNDPTQPWHYYSFGVGGSNGLAPGLWFDYPSIGINSTDFCVAGNLFDNNDNFQSNLVLLLNKADGYGDSTLNNEYFTGIPDGKGKPGFSLAPATAAQDVPYTNVFFLVSTLSSGGSYLSTYTITGNALSDLTTYSSTAINTPQYLPSATATEPEGIQLANYKAGCRVESAIYMDSTIQFVFSADYVDQGIDYNSLYFNRFNLSTNTISQNWSYESGSNYNYPSIASYGTSATDLTVALCFLKTDPTTNPEILFKYFDSEMNQLSAVSVRAGDSLVDYRGVSVQRWGDFTTTQRRYNASQPEAWMSGSFGNKHENWQTHIAQITGYPGTVGISEVDLSNPALQVFPNPVASQLYIKGNLSSITGFPQVYTMDGRRVQIAVTRKGNEMFQIDVANLASGVYVIKMNNGQTVKFIKN